MKTAALIDSYQVVVMTDSLDILAGILSMSNCLSQCRPGLEHHVIYNPLPVCLIPQTAKGFIDLWTWRHRNGNEPRSEVSGYATDINK